MLNSILLEKYIISNKELLLDLKSDSWHDHIGSPHSRSCG